MPTRSALPALLSCLGSGLAVVGLAGAVAAGGVTLEAPDPVHSFGRVRQGERIEHRFVIRNPSDAAQRIAGVSLSEPGMKVRFRRDLAAGASGSIGIEWDTTRIEGEVEAEATVFLEPDSAPALVLRLEGRIVPRVEIEPLAAIYVSQFRGECVPRSVRIHNHDPLPFEIRAVVPEGEHFVAVLRTIESGREFELSVEVPDDVAPGRYLEAVRLVTSRPDIGDIRVPVNVLVKDEPFVSVDAVDFGRVSIEQVRRHPGMLDFLVQTFMVKAREDLEILDLWWDQPTFEVDRTPDGRSATFRLDVRLVPELLRPGVVQGTIHILTDARPGEALAIPVRVELE